eukprot:scaffold6695_cov136-Isochrysis_galbana.AAC.5
MGGSSAAAMAGRPSRRGNGHGRCATRSSPHGQHTRRSEMVQRIVEEHVGVQGVMHLNACATRQA